VTLKTNRSKLHLKNPLPSKVRLYLVNLVPSGRAEEFKVNVRLPNHEGGEKKTMLLLTDQEDISQCSAAITSIMKSSHFGTMTSTRNTDLYPLSSPS